MDDSVNHFKHLKKTRGTCTSRQSRNMSCVLLCACRTSFISIIKIVKVWTFTCFWGVDLLWPWLGFTEIVAVLRFTHTSGRSSHCSSIELYPTDIPSHPYGVWRACWYRQTVARVMDVTCGGTTWHQEKKTVLRTEAKCFWLHSGRDQQPFHTRGLCNQTLCQ